MSSLGYGINLLKNSSGLLGTNNWNTDATSSVKTYTDTTGSVSQCISSGIVLMHTNSGSMWSDSFKLKPNTSYTISGYSYVGLNCYGLKIQLVTSSEILIYSDTTYSSGVYKYFSKTITTGSGIYSGYLKFTNLGNGSNYFGNIMVQEGTVATDWYPNPNEIKNDSVQIDGNGIIGNSKSSNNTNHTEMTDNGLNVYYNGQNAATLMGSSIGGRLRLYYEGGLFGTIDSLNSESTTKPGMNITSYYNPGLQVTNNQGASIWLNGTNVSYTGSLVKSSDYNFKQNISEISSDDALKFLMELNPVKYEYKENPEKKHYGLIAQEVLDILDKFNIDKENNALVSKNADDSYGIDYTNIIALLISAIQSQQKQIDELSNK